MVEQVSGKGNDTMRNITLLGTAVAALTATMLLASPASAYRDRDHYGDRSHRGDMYMYGGRNRDHYRDRDYYGDRRSGIHLHVPGIGGIQLGH
jgi:hypothetical protein